MTYLKCMAAGLVAAILFGLVFLALEAAAGWIQILAWMDEGSAGGYAGVSSLSLLSLLVAVLIGFAIGFRRQRRRARVART